MFPAQEVQWQAGFNPPLLAARGFLWPEAPFASLYHISYVS